MESTATGYINAMYVRFRSGPSTSSSVLGEYNQGKELTITGTSGDWTASVIDGQAGYVSSQSVTAGSAPNAGGSNGSTGAGGGVTVVGGGSETPSEQPSENGGGTVVIPGSSNEGSTPSEPETTPVDAKPGYIDGDYVRFRTGPSTSNNIIATYNRGKELTITGISGEWTACTIDGKDGYIFSQYVKESSNGSTGGGNGTVVGSENPGNESSGGGNGTVVGSENPGNESSGGGTGTVVGSEGSEGTVNTGSEPGYITGNNVYFRSGPSMNSEILDQLFYGNSVTITGTNGDWTAVIYNGRSGYVYSQYVTKGEYQHTSSGGNSELGRQIADYALQFVGYRYTWGGTSPSTGFDCSGLMYYVYQQFGYTLNRVANDQARNGVHVDPSDLQPGDLLCFYSSSSYIGHVGMYIGNNMFVHAQNSATGVIISELSGYYADRGYEARRII